MIETYGYTPCTSCRQTDAFLKESGVEYSNRDFFKQPFSAVELRDVLDRARLSVRDVLSRRSKPYHARMDEIEAMSDDDLFSLMLEEPRLIRRPLVITGDSEQGYVGHNRPKLEELVAR